MRCWLFAALLVASTTPSFSAEPLPLTDGIYVKEGVSCKGASNVDTLSFWKKDGGINSSQVGCKIKSYEKKGNIYALKQLCTEIHNGGEFDNNTTITIVNKKIFAVESGTYRYCGKKMRF